MYGYNGKYHGAIGFVFNLVYFNAINVLRDCHIHLNTDVLGIIQTAIESAINHIFPIQKCK